MNRLLFLNSLNYDERKFWKEYYVFNKEFFKSSGLFDSVDLDLLERMVFYRLYDESNDLYLGLSHLSLGYGFGRDIDKEDCYLEITASKIFFKIYDKEEKMINPKQDFSYKFWEIKQNLDKFVNIMNKLIYMSKKDVEDLDLKITFEYKMNSVFKMNKNDDNSFYGVYFGDIKNDRW